MNNIIIVPYRGDLALFIPIMKFDLLTPRSYRGQTKVTKVLAKVTIPRKLKL